MKCLRVNPNPPVSAPLRMITVRGDLAVSIRVAAAAAAAAAALEDPAGGCGPRELSLEEAVDEGAGEDDATSPPPPPPLLPVQ